MDQIIQLSVLHDVSHEAKGDAFLEEDLHISRVAAAVVQVYVLYSIFLPSGAC